jgi:argininosuccinate lyase
MADCEVNTTRMAERANSDFLTVTELADTLVRSENLSFSEAHHVVSEAVRMLEGAYSPKRMLDCLLSLRPFSTPREVLAKALDAANFIAVRSIPGGPAPAMVRAAMDEAGEEADSTAAWIAEKVRLLEEYPKRIAAARQSLFKEV